MKSTSSISIKVMMLVAFVNICVSQTQDFDFFYFVLQWPGSFCDTQKSCCFPPTGKPASNFSIHGLWPNFSNGTFPSDCNAQNPFNQSEIADLIPRAQIGWPSISCAGSNKSENKNTRSDNSRFWKHEWDKHGTCSDSILDQHSYFKTSLDLKDRVDLLQILQYYGIKPDGKLYSVDKISKAIEQGMGFVPGITCNTNPSGNRQLFEIYLCVDKSASNFVECPLLPKQIQSCTENIEFPIF